MLPPPQSFSLNLTLADNDVHNLFPANFLRKQYEWIQTSSNADHYISSEVGLFIAKHHKSSFWCMNLLIKLKRFPKSKLPSGFYSQNKAHTYKWMCTKQKKNISHGKQNTHFWCFPQNFLEKRKRLATIITKQDWISYIST